MEAVDAGPDAVAILVRFDVFGTGLDRRFQDLVGIAGAGGIFDQPEPLEAVADAAARAQIAAILGEDRADVGRGAVAVVGQRFDDDRDSAGAEAFVADLLVIGGVAARRLVDRPLDIVLGHRLGARGDHRGTKTRIRIGVGQAHFRRDGDLAAQLGEEGGALLILRALPVHDVLVFGMPGHGCSLRQAESRAIGFHQRVGLLARVRFHFSQSNDRPHRLGVIAVGLGFRIDVANIVRDALLLFLQTLDPLDKQPQLVGRDGALRHVLGTPFSNVSARL